MPADALKSVVVSGASGFLGRRLVPRLLGHGIRVVAASRSGAEVPGAETLRVDDYGDIECGAGAVLVHLAEPRGIVGADASGDRHVANVAGLVGRLLEKPWLHVVYASSTAVYGDATATPHRANEMVEPRGAYAVGKRACEQLVLARGGTVVRLSNIYGPGMAPDNVVSDAIAQIPGNGPIALRDLMPVRDFVWVDDAAEAVALAVTRRPGGVLNIASGESVSILELARTCLRLAGEPGREVLATAPRARESIQHLDIEASRHLLGWAPHTSLEQGLAILLGHADARHGTPVRS